MKNFNETGITLIALAVTIIILIILAGINISTLNGKNGILNQANSAKIMTIVSGVKEEIELKNVECQVEDISINIENLLKEGKIERIVKPEYDTYYIYYIIKPKSYISMKNLGNGNSTEFKDIFLIDDDFNIKYIDKFGNEYGDNLTKKELTDETKIRFASENFEKYVSKISGIETNDLKFKWMKNQKSLKINDASITNLYDLVFFPNLTNLEINGLTLKNLDGIENCKNLEVIYCYSIVDDLSKVEYLKNLNSIYITKLQNFDNAIDSLKGLEKLKTLSISGNITVKSMKRIEELNNSLAYITLSNVGIEKIEGLKKFTNLKSINLTTNNIKDITPIADIASINNITGLYLDGNKNISGNRSDYTKKELEKINKIGEILDRDGEITLEVEQFRLFTNYKNVKLNYKGLTSLEMFEGMTNLNKLDLAGNYITLEDEKSQNILKSMKNLRSLNLFQNKKLANIKPINELSSLTDLNLSSTRTFNLADIEDILSNVSLSVDNSTFQTIVNCDANKITSLKMSWAPIQDIPDMSNLTKLKYLQIDDSSSINSFDTIAKLESLEVLRLNRDSLHNKMFDFSRLTNLNNLSLEGNFLWSEDLNKLKSLKNNKNLNLNLSNNSIIDATALLELDATTRINLKNNVNLNENSKNKLKAKFNANVTF